MKDDLKSFVSEEYPDWTSEMKTIRNVREELISILRSGKEVCHYKELAEKFGLSFDYASERNELSEILGIISRFEISNERPMLSAIVVRKDTGRPGNGFYPWARSISAMKEKEGNEEFWLRQIRELRKVWKKA